MDKHYISDIDRALAEFNARHKKSESQQAEVEKYRRVYALRDKVVRKKLVKKTLFSD